MTETADLVLKGGVVVSADHAVEASIAVRDGVVVAIGVDETMPPANESIDVTGMHILPGVVDVHVHFRDPGERHKEDFATGSAAAACGGVTTVFDMPNVTPPTTNLESLELKKRAVSEKAFVDYGLYGLLGEDNVDKVDELVDGGVIGFKCFTDNTFGHSRLGASTGAMLDGFQAVARHGLRISLHAESASIMGRREAQLVKQGRVDLAAHLEARPPVVAIEAVSRAAILAEWTGARIQILHISSGDELRPLREARRRGVDIAAETCPHYLLFDSGDFERIGNQLRVNPPIRESWHRERLWAALADGTLDMISTDHAPHARDEKLRANIWKVESGLSGIETQMPLMLTEVNAGRLSITRYVALTARNPARAWGLYPRKGALQIGSDADMAIVDLKRTATIDDNELHSRSKISPWHGREVQGLPIHTLVRGRFVMRDRKLVDSARGWGKSVRNKQSMTPTD